MKISVCMATYNGEKYIKEQMLSILSQIKKGDEVIISDDHSTDRTIEIINCLNDQRIHIFFNNKEKGYTRNFENSLEKSTGDIIFLADQDDVWMDNKVDLFCQQLQNYSFVVSDCVIVNNVLKTIDKSHFKLRSVKKGFLRNLFLPRYVGACMAFKRNVLLKSLPFPKNSSLAAHDYWICLVAEYYFDTKLINQPLILYRRHGDNASNGGNKSTNSLYHRLSVRLYALYNLMKLK